MCASIINNYKHLVNLGTSKNDGHVGFVDARVMMRVFGSFSILLSDFCLLAFVVSGSGFEMRYARMPGTEGWIEDSI